MTSRSSVSWPGCCSPPRTRSRRCTTRTRTSTSSTASPPPGSAHLSDDWLANTADPTPVFSAFVAAGYRALGEWPFQAVFFAAARRLLPRACGAGRCRAAVSPRHRTAAVGLAVGRRRSSSSTPGSSAGRRTGCSGPTTRGSSSAGWRTSTCSARGCSRRWSGCC